MPSNCNVCGKDIYKVDTMPIDGVDYCLKHGKQVSVVKGNIIKRYLKNLRKQIIKGIV